MKIDTSKLTPIQAQQIEAIASGVPFNLRNHGGKPFHRSPIAITMTSAQDPEYYDRLIERHTGILNDLIAKNDIDAIESQQRHINRLESRRAGNPSWECVYEIRSERYNDLSISWRQNHGASLLAKINATLVEKYGLENLTTKAWSLYPEVSFEASTWREAHHWYLDHLRLDDDEVVATVDTIVSEYVAALPISARLSIQRGKVSEGWSFHRYLLGRPLRNLKAALSKTLDTLRTKA